MKSKKFLSSANNVLKPINKMLQPRIAHGKKHHSFNRVRLQLLSFSRYNLLAIPPTWEFSKRANFVGFTEEKV